MSAATIPAPSGEIPTSGERHDLVTTIDRHRGFLRQTLRGLTDEQVRLRPTASELCLGGLIKHVTAVEAGWAEFIVSGPRAIELNEDTYGEWMLQFQMLEGETIDDLLDKYDAVARRTDELATTVDLDASQPLPEAPWFEAGARYSARRVLLHIIAETAQHAGHADILRETIDGSKTMG